MLRILCLITAIAIIPFTSVYSLGLGDIHHTSYLNQKFNANIELLFFSQDEINTLKIGLASAEAFTQAGVDRAFHLLGLHFETIIQNKESAVIRVTSQQPIREPFLDFLVEAKWPNGTVIREYKVLLDPPGQVDNPMSISQAPHLSTNSLEYGPITPKDTLWSIAKKIKPANFSITQIMNALLIQNPDAFINNNPHYLLTGKTLRLSSSQSTLGKQSNAASSRQKPVKQTSSDKKISPSLKSKLSLPQWDNQLSQKFIRDEIDKLQKALEVLYQSEQQRSEQHRQTQNKQLFALIEALNFKVKDIQLMLISQNAQIKASYNPAANPLEELFPTESSVITATLPDKLEATTSIPTSPISNITPEQIIINPEVTQLVTTSVDEPIPQSKNNYLSLQIVLSTFACLLLLLKIFLTRRSQMNNKTVNSTPCRSSPISPKTSTEINQTSLSPSLMMEQITKTSSQVIESKNNILVDELQEDLNLEQELDQLLEEAATSVNLEDNNNTDYISKMVTTIHPHSLHPVTDEQGISDALESHLS